MSLGDVHVRDAECLQTLLEQLDEGISLYRNAAEHAVHSEHRAIFARMLRSREFARDYLAPFTDKMSSAYQRGHAFGSVLNKMYPDILFGLDRHFDDDLIDKALHLELATFNAMRDAVNCIESSILKSVLIDLYPQINGDQHGCWVIKELARAS